MVNSSVRNFNSLAASLTVLPNNSDKNNTFLRTTDKLFLRTGNFKTIRQKLQVEWKLLPVILAGHIE
ncbi:MAG: hypothetical protein ACRCUY_03550 [Thermoguttaceae bacterium]